MTFNLANAQVVTTQNGNLRHSSKGPVKFFATEKISSAKYAQYTVSNTTKSISVTTVVLTIGGFPDCPVALKYVDPVLEKFASMIGVSDGDLKFSRSCAAAGRRLAETPAVQLVQSIECPNRLADKCAAVVAASSFGEVMIVSLNTFNAGQTDQDQLIADKQKVAIHVLGDNHFILHAWKMCKDNCPESVEHTECKEKINSGTTLEQCKEILKKCMNHCSAIFS
jgi:hypothetical protein